MKRFLFFPAVLLVAPLMAADFQWNGVMPEECSVVSLGRLPAKPDGVPTTCLARLSPSGTPMLFHGGRLALPAIDPGERSGFWALPKETAPVRDFCLLNDRTLAVLRETRLDLVCTGVVVRSLALPDPSMRMEPAGVGQYYLFGGTGALWRADVFLGDFEGNLKKLFHAPHPVTAVTGNGRITLVAVGPVVLNLEEGREPQVVFKAEQDIVQLALAPPASVFYSTGHAVGCVTGVAQGYVVLRNEIASISSRGGNLLLMGNAGDLLLVRSVSAFSRVGTDLRKQETASNTVP